jgi:hypothetical protein
VRNPRQTRDHHAKGHSTGQAHQRRTHVTNSQKFTHSLSSSSSSPESSEPGSASYSEPLSSSSFESSSRPSIESLGKSSHSSSSLSLGSTFLFDALTLAGWGFLISDFLAVLVDVLTCSSELSLSILSFKAYFLVSCLVGFAIALGVAFTGTFFTAVFLVRAICMCFC